MHGAPLSCSLQASLQFMSKGPVSEEVGPSSWVEVSMGWRVCSKPGCGALHQGTGRCPTCRAQADKDRRPKGNPYSTRGHQRFREQVLAKHPRCVCIGECGRHDTMCGAVSTVADHWPLERVEMIEAGRDPDDPSNGRGLCAPCHGGKTALTRPGGWNASP